MDAVEVRKALDGAYWVTARADSLAEAMRGVDALLGINSPAFEAARYAAMGGPVLRDPAPELSPAMTVLADRLEASENPTDGLRAGTATDDDLIRN